MGKGVVGSPPCFSTIVTKGNTVYYFQLACTGYVVFLNRVLRKRKKIVPLIVLNPIVLRMAKTPSSFGHSEYSRVNDQILFFFKS